MVTTQMYNIHSLNAFELANIEVQTKGSDGLLLPPCYSQKDIFSVIFSELAARDISASGVLSSRNAHIYPISIGSSYHYLRLLFRPPTK